MSTSSTETAEADIGDRTCYWWRETRTKSFTLWPLGALSIVFFSKWHKKCCRLHTYFDHFDRGQSTGRILIGWSCIDYVAQPPRHSKYPPIQQMGLLFRSKHMGRRTCGGTITNDAAEIMCLHVETNDLVIYRYSPRLLISSEIERLPC